MMGIDIKNVLIMTVTVMIGIFVVKYVVTKTGAENLPIIGDVVKAV